MSGSLNGRSIPELFGDTVEQLGKLVQNEIQLARAEISQKITQAGMGAAYIAAAAVLIIPVLVILLITLALWLNQMGLSPIASHLIAATAGGLISVLLALIGMRYLTSESLAPRVTMRQVERDVAAAKEMVK